MERYTTQFGPQQVEFPRRPMVMGIVNVNDDSFSGDGSLIVEELIAQCVSQISAGADIVDLGAESARTNREAISEAEEVRRLHSVLEHWEQIVSMSTPRDEAQVYPPVVSINTWRPTVIREVLTGRYGEMIGLVNDMSALAYPETLEIMRESEAAWLLMHSVGLPKQDHSSQRWDDIVEVVDGFFKDKVEQALAAGIPRERLVLDPGLDFAKPSEDSVRLIAEVERFKRFGCCLLLPLSRKNFIGEVLQEEEPQRRDAGTVACIPALMGLSGVMLRVHHVEATWQAVKVLSALDGGGRS